MMTISRTHVVLGSSGFLGEKLVTHFLAKGERVIGIDLCPTDLRHPRFQFIESDFRRVDYRTLGSLDVFHHVASLVPLKHSFDEGNVKANEDLVKSLAGLSVGTFLYYSSSAVAARSGSALNPIHPDEPVSPIEEYGESKAEAEKIFSRLNVPVIILRPRTILGPGRLGLFELLFSWISRGKTVFLPAEPDFPAQFIHVDDLVSAVEVMLERRATGIFHVGNSPSESLLHDLRQLIALKESSSQILCLKGGAITGLELLHRMGLSPFARWQYLSFGGPHILDTQRTRDLGWVPRSSNLAMLSESFDWYLANKRNLAGSSVHRSPLELGHLRFLR